MSPTPHLLLLSIFTIFFLQLKRLVGMPTDTEVEIEAAAKKLQGMGVANVLVTIGSKGSLLYRDKGLEVVKQGCFKVDTVVDTT